jgi:hypothetical protein
MQHRTWVAIIASLIAVHYCSAGTGNPEEMVGVWECKDSQYGHIVVRLPDGRVAAVDFERAGPDRPWRKVGTLMGTWERKGKKYKLDVTRHLLQKNEIRKQNLSYSIGERNESKLVLFPDYDALAMVESKIGPAPDAHQTAARSIASVLAPYVKRFEGK